MPIERQILLLEDDMIQTMLFRAAVDGVLGTVTNFTDASDAINIMQRSRIDLCVVDLGVFTRPGVFHREGGNRFISQVRHKITRTTPIIVATSGRKPATLLASFQAGADDYVLKDEGLDKVLDRIRMWIKELPATQSLLDTKRAKVLEFLEKAEQNGLDLPE
ncbi:MAG: response regulator [Thalassobaculaceae bacterium]|nr:response regulator [Thalassobaculaceae bacterium]